MNGVHVMDEDDRELLDAVRDAWLDADPVPPTLAERITFALHLEDLDLEAELLTLLPEAVGARGEERTRTVTFSGSSLSVMVTVSEDGPGTVRLDGWVDAGDGAPGQVAGLRTELRLQGLAPSLVPLEADGRFVLDRVRRGLAQLAFRLPGGRTVVTPAVEL